jgi:hypothetical protein
MTRRDELKARLEAVGKRRFFLAMKDRWDSNDYALDNKLFREELAIKKELAK